MYLNRVEIHRDRIATAGQAAQEEQMMYWSSGRFVCPQSWLANTPVRATGGDEAPSSPQAARSSSLPAATPHPAPSNPPADATATAVSTAG